MKLRSNMATKLAIANMKGGIGKTTTALCLADALKRKKKKVLLIDLDPQKSATGIYQANTKDVLTLADIMYCGATAAECVQHTALGDIIPSDTALQDAETQIKADADRFYHLSDSCTSLEEKYDFIICDCPPGNGVLLGNALSYVNYVIMPITADKFGIQGMHEFNDVMHSYTKRINPALKILGIVMIKYKGRQTLTKDLEQNLLPTIVKDMNTQLFSTKIRESVKCQESQALNKSLYEYAPSCTTAIDYQQFAEEILKELNNEE